MESVATPCHGRRWSGHVKSKFCGPVRGMVGAGPGGIGGAGGARIDSNAGKSASSSSGGSFT